MSIFRFKQRRGTTAACEACTDKPLDGELIIERCTTGSVKMKVGDGQHVFSELPYISTEVADLPVATSSTLGGIKVGTGLSITNGGVLSANGGGVADSVEWDDVQNKPTEFTPSAHTHSQYLTDHQTLKTINNQSIVGEGNITIEAGSEYTLPTANASTLGGIKVGSGLAIDNNGVLSATGSSITMEEYSDSEIQGFWNEVFTPTT